MHARSLTLAGLVLVAAIAVPASAKGGPPATEPDESGCRDVVSGVARYQYLIQSVEQEEVLPPVGSTLGLYREAVVTLSDKSVATARLVLAAPSCTDVEYTVEAYDIDTQQLLAAHTQSGDGVTGTSDNNLFLEAVVRGYTKDTIALRVFTTSRGTVHDVAPDAGSPPVEATAAADGTPNGTGGANSSFK
jgi:hypothetical protein